MAAEARGEAKLCFKKRVQGERGQAGRVLWGALDAMEGRLGHCRAWLGGLQT